MTEDLANKNILITGGTSRLGSEFVKKAAAAGAKIFFTYHQADQEAKKLEASGAKSFQLDLSDTQSIDGFAQTFRKEQKHLDVLIHNSAAVRDRLLRDMTEEDWDYVLDVNLKAPYYLTKKLLPCLFKSQQAKVFMITSRVGIRGGYGVSNYAAAKAGLIAMAKSLAAELGKKKILVNAVNPGFMHSRMTENLPEKAVQKNLSDSPLNAYSNPAEVAEFLIYLSSDKMTQVSGQTFHFESRSTCLG